MVLWFEKAGATNLGQRPEGQLYRTPMRSSSSHRRLMGTNP